MHRHWAIFPFSFIPPSPHSFLSPAPPIPSPLRPRPCTSRPVFYARAKSPPYQYARENNNNNIDCDVIPLPPSPYPSPPILHPYVNPFISSTLLYSCYQKLKPPPYNLSKSTNSDSLFFMCGKRGGGGRGRN